MYTKIIDRLSAVRNNKKSGFSFPSGGLGGSQSYYEIQKRKLLEEQKQFNESFQINRSLFNDILDVESSSKELGHSDFKYLKNTNLVEHHNIVSVFVDILGSTNLHKEYDLNEIYIITNTIQTAVIKTFLLFGGHIQRLEGDGVFAYFGGKGIAKKKAVELAMLASSCFVFFMENEVKKVFENDEIENIKIKIGIDFGDDDKVMWANFGIDSLSELTTVSLHTSLAKKMQSYAKSNGIIVGQNIKNLLQVEEDLFDFVRDAQGVVTQKYIYQDSKIGFYYTQYRFNWKKFLSKQSFVIKNGDGSFRLKDTEELLRIERLNSKVNLINSSNASLLTTGGISAFGDGIKHQPHRFHYGK